jgi:glutamate decarboxylase
MQVYSRIYNALVNVNVIRGRMMVSDLEAKINQAKANGSLPFFVSATAGTTVLGAFDPLNDIADVCTKYGLWFHVDVRR